MPRFCPTFTVLNAHKSVLIGAFHGLEYGGACKDGGLERIS